MKLKRRMTTMSCLVELPVLRRIKRKFGWPIVGEPCEFHGLATVGDFKSISAAEKDRLLQNSSVCEEYLEELQEGFDDMEQESFFKFLCSSCGEVKFLEDLS